MIRVDLYAWSKVPEMGNNPLNKVVELYAEAYALAGEVGRAEGGSTEAAGDAGAVSVGGRSVHAGSEARSAGAAGAVSSAARRRCVTEA